MKKKPSGTAKHLRQIYTIEGGPENHDYNVETKVYLRIAAVAAIASLIGKVISKIETLEIKALKKGDD